MYQLSVTNKRNSFPWDHILDQLLTRTPTRNIIRNKIDNVRYKIGKYNQTNCNISQNVHNATNHAQLYATTLWSQLNHAQCKKYVQR